MISMARNLGAPVIEPPGLPAMQFDPATDLVFDYGPSLPGHANGMIIKATDAQGDVILEETYYSIGGGFVVTEAEQSEAAGQKAKARADVPYHWPTGLGALMGGGLNLSLKSSAFFRLEDFFPGPPERFE